MFRHFCLFLILVGLLPACSVHKDARPLPETVVHVNHVAPVAGKKLSYSCERRYNALFLEAVRQKQLDHFDQEYELLDAALRINPRASEALYEMGVLKLTFSTFSDTLSKAEGDSLLRLSVKLEPENLYYKETLADYLANNADYKGAIQLFEEIASARLTNEVLATLVWLYKTNQDYAGAIRTLDRLERLDGKSESLSIEKFQTYLAMGDSEKAFWAIEELCAEYPYDLRYRVLLGDLYDQHGYHERALDIYRDVLTAEPDNSYAQISLLAYYKAAQADSLYMDFLQRVVLNPRTQEGARLEAMRTYAVDNINSGGDPQKVLHLFNEVLAQPQESREMAELLAGYVSEKKLPEDSLLHALHRIIEIEPDYSKARLKILQIMIQRNDKAEVLKTCREGILYDPSELTFYYYEGIMLYDAGQNVEAINILQDGTERIDENTDRRLASDVYATLGDILHEQKLNEEAYLAYDKALEYNDMNLFCLNNYAYFLSQEGRHLEKAEQMSHITVDMEGQNPTYLDTYAWILFQMGHYEQARVYINEALRHITETEENLSILDHAGDIFFRCNDRRQAVEYWKKALQLAKDKTVKRRLQRKVWRKRI